MKKLTARQIEIYELIKRHIERTSLPPTRAEIAKELGFKSVNGAEDHLRALARKGAIEVVPGCSRGIRLLLETPNTDKEGFRAQIEGNGLTKKRETLADSLKKKFEQQTSQASSDEDLGSEDLQWKNKQESESELTNLFIEETEEEEEEGLPLIGRVAAGDPILALEHIESHYAVDPTMFTPQADFLLRVCGDSMIDIGIYDGDLLVVHKTTIVRNGQVVVARVEDDVTVKRFERRGNLIYLHPENEKFKPYVIDPSYQEFAIEGLAVGIIRNNF